MVQILEARAVIDTEIPKLKLRVRALAKRGIAPHLKVLLVGSHPASLSYVSSKKKFCEQVGASSEVVLLPESISSDELKLRIKQLNDDPSVHGILLQLPLPNHLSGLELERLIVPKKDVDGFTLENLGALFLNTQPKNHSLPCTPKGILKLLHFYNISLKGKKVCILGRSQIVGRPFSMLALRENATVEVCHSHTPNPKQAALSADVLIAAIGKPKFVGPDWCHSSQIVIDVGINRDEHGKLCGDVDYEKVAPIVHAITPVPGGIGRMTVLSLIENLVENCEDQCEGNIK